MFLSSYVALGESLRWLLALLLSGLVAVGTLCCGVYGLQCLAGCPVRTRWVRARTERRISREARRGIADLEAYLSRELGPRADSGSG